MAISNPLNRMRKAGTVGKPFPGVQVSQVNRKELMFIDTLFFSWTFSSATFLSL